MIFEEEVLVKAHKKCRSHKDEVLASPQCGCFYCLGVFDPFEINEWVGRDGTQAVCPRCGINSILGSNSGYPVTSPEFLKAMHARWFERTVYVKC